MKQCSNWITWSSVILVVRQSMGRICRRGVQPFFGGVKAFLPFAGTGISHSAGVRPALGGTVSRHEKGHRFAGVACLILVDHVLGTLNVPPSRSAEKGCQ